MSGKRASVAAAVAGLLAIGGIGAAAANAATAPAAPPRWHIVKTVPGEAAGAFTAVVATGKSTGWAFDAPSTSGPSAAYERQGGTWTRRAFPGLPDEGVISAAASSPSNVWAVTSIFAATSRVLRFNGHKWSVVKSFTKQVNRVSVLSGNDVWLFGLVGVLHFNGHGWTKVGGGDFLGGSALSDKDVYAITPKNVDHFNGHSWTATSVASLLPPIIPSGLNHPELVDIIALSDHNIYATANGNAQDAGGPIAVLHFDGHTWTKKAQGGDGYGGSASPDGHGGLWIPMPGASGETPFMLHYTGGKLVRLALPSRVTALAIGEIPGTAQQLAGGWIRAKSSPVSAGAVILQFS
jgi:hypothetical protein